MPYSSGYVWYAVFLLFVVNVFNYIDRMALAVLAPFIKADLNLSDAQLGLLTGFAFALFYAICGLPMARWADRGVRRDIIAIALATWSVMTALCGLSQTFWHLFLARIGIGVGEAGSLPSGQSILCDYVPAHRRPGIFAIHTFGLHAGLVIGMACAGWFGATLGWRWTFVMFGLPGIGLAIVVRLTLREPIRGASDTVSDGRSSTTFIETIRTLLSCRTYRLLVACAVLDNFVQYGLSQWRPSFYVRVFGLELSFVGVYLGLALAVGSATGLLLGGFIANKVGQRDARLPLQITAVAIALGFPIALASVFVSSAHLSLVLVGITGIFWGVASGPTVAALYNVTAPRMRATAGALSIFSIALLGFGLGPFCIGWLSDVFTPWLGSQALRYATVVPICLHPLTMILLYAAAKSVRRDMNAVSAKLQRLAGENVSTPAAPVAG